MPLCSLFTQQPDKLLKMLSQDMKPSSKPPTAPHWHLKHTLLTPVFEAPHDLEPRTLPGLITLFRLINWSFAALWTTSPSPASTWNVLSPDIHMAGSFFLHWDWMKSILLSKHHFLKEDSSEHLLERDLPHRCHFLSSYPVLFFFITVIVTWHYIFTIFSHYTINPKKVGARNSVRHNLFVGERWGGGRWEWVVHGIVNWYEPSRKYLDKIY